MWKCAETALLAQADRRRTLIWQVSVDSTTARAHIHAGGARRDSGDVVPGNRIITRWVAPAAGSARTSHLTVDQRRRAVSFRLTPGQAGDSPEMVAVLEAIRVASPAGGGPASDPTGGPRPNPSRANRDWLSRHAIRVTIPIPADQAKHHRRHGVPRRSITRVRPADLPGPACGRMRHQRPQTPPRHGPPWAADPGEEIDRVQALTDLHVSPEVDRLMEEFSKTLRKIHETERLLK